MPTIWDEIRADFPGLQGQAYLNAAATSVTPRPVREAAEQYLRQLEAGGDSYHGKWMLQREVVRAKVAAFVGARPEEIAFVPNTSAGLNLAIDLLEAAGPVLASEIEFPALTLPWIHRGVQVRFVKPRGGVVEVEAFAEDVAPRAATIVLSHVQFTNGCRQDLGAFGMAKGSRHLVVVGSQSIGAFPVNVRRSHVDAFATSGHKWLCAGHGAGFCYVSKELVDLHPPRAVGWMSGEDPWAFDNRHMKVLPTAARVESGTPSFAPIFALGAAIDYLVQIGTEEIAERVLALSLYLASRLHKERFEILSPGGAHQSGQTMVLVADSRRARQYLATVGVHVSAMPTGVRVSTHFYNNEEDVDRCVQALVHYRDQLES